MSAILVSPMKTLTFRTFDLTVDLIEIGLSLVILILPTKLEL